MQGQLQRIHKVARNVGQSQRRDVIQVLCSVVWLQRMHYDLVARDGESVGDTLREELINLRDRDWAGDDKWIIETIIEANLDERRV